MSGEVSKDRRDQLPAKRPERRHRQEDYDLPPRVSRQPMDGTLPDPEWVMVGVPVPGRRKDGGEGRKRLYASKDVPSGALNIRDWKHVPAYYLSAVMRQVLIITEDTYSECLARLMEIWENQGALDRPAEPRRKAIEAAEEVVEGEIVEDGTGLLQTAREYADRMAQGGYVTPMDGEDASSYLDRLLAGSGMPSPIKYESVPPPQYPPHTSACVWPDKHYGPCTPRQWANDEAQAQPGDIVTIDAVCSAGLVLPGVKHAPAGDEVRPYMHIDGSVCRHKGPGRMRTVVIGHGEPVVTKTGKVLTKKDIEELADEAERGYDVSGSQAFYGDPSGPELPMPPGFPLSAITVIADDRMPDDTVAVVSDTGAVTFAVDPGYDKQAPTEEDNDHESAAAQPAERPGPGGDRGDEHPADPAV